MTQESTSSSTASSNRSAVFDQRGQTVHGSQTNIAGDVVTGGGIFNSGTINTSGDFVGRNKNIITTTASIDLDSAQTQLAAMPLDSLPPIAALPPGSLVPFTYSPLFVGRTDELVFLARALQGSNTATVSSVATTGIGGIGKTRLAAAFVHHYGQYFLGGVYWLNFADPAAIPAEVARCAAFMNDLPPGVMQLSLPEQVQMVRRAWQEPVPRLLIFDNCEDPALLVQWQPTYGGCRILVTSRRTIWNKSLGIRVVPLGVLSRMDSVALLARFRPDLRDDPILSAIAEELGDLPLALHLAGSYLERYLHGVTPAQYLTQLRQPNLLQNRSLQAGDLSPTNHVQHIVRTFALSYEQLDGSNEIDVLAQEILAAAACFAPREPIPWTLIRHALHNKNDDLGER